MARLLSRRRLLLSLPAVPAAALATKVAPAEAMVTRSYGGPSLRGWDVVLGDGLYAAPGEQPVSLADIRSDHYADQTELVANPSRRRIMAHNITVKTVESASALRRLHRGAYSFRLPYLPQVDNFDLNAQTIEGGIFIWDGPATRLDYGVAFQWALNPWMDEFGDIRTWTEWDGGQWQKVGFLTPDTEWHRVRFGFDPVNRTSSITIDGLFFPSAYSRTPKPEDWGTEIAARLQAEIISLYPGEDNPGTLHRAEFRDWSWRWATPS